MASRPSASRSKAEFGRHARRTLYVVAGFYVIVGFVAATASAVSGDRLGTFLGFLIISGALGGAVILRSVLNVEAGVAVLREAVVDARDRLAHLERGLLAPREPARTTETAATDSGARQLLDLASIGQGDPSVLTAATLDRAVFPRLVASMEEDPPAQSYPPTATFADIPTEVPHVGTDFAIQPDSTADVTTAPASINLLRQWKIALRNGDLAGCRAVYAAIVDTAGPEEADPLRVQIEELADRVERSLRNAFASHVRSQDFAAALALGERMTHLLPDRAVVAEFHRLEPHLRRRVEQPDPLPLSSAGT